MPTMVIGEPSRRTFFPRISGSLPNRSRQARWLTIATGSPPSTSSCGRNARPTVGARPSTSK